MSVWNLLVNLGLGATVASCCFLVYFKLHKKFQMDWKAWSVVIVSVAAVIFALAWTHASIMEDETQAAYMGLFVFGIPGILIGILGGRFLIFKRS